MRKLFVVVFGLVLGCGGSVGCGSSKDAEPTVINKADTPGRLPKNKPGQQ